MLSLVRQHNPTVATDEKCNAVKKNRFDNNIYDFLFKKNKIRLFHE